MESWHILHIFLAFMFAFICAITVGQLLRWAIKRKNIRKANVHKFLSNSTKWIY